MEKYSYYAIFDASSSSYQWVAALSACLVKLVTELSILLSCLLFYSLILCNFDCYFAYLLFASLGSFMFCLCVCLRVATLLRLPRCMALSVIASRYALPGCGDRRVWVRGSG